MYRPWHIKFRTLWVLALLIVSSWQLRAQLTVGDNVNMRMDGQLGVGYGGDYGTALPQSSHGTYFSGMGTLSGFYYNPQFLSFNVQPFYNRNQDNSQFASVFNDTGVNASTNLFSGSHFPGAVSFAKSYADGSQYGIAGFPGLSTNGTNQTFSVTWSAFVPRLPTLTATFADSSSSDNIIGETGTTDTSIRSFNLNSTYVLAGFQLYGFLNHQNLNATLPEFITGETFQTDSSTNTYGISANHRIPLNGNFNLGYTRSSYTSDTSAVLNSGTTNTVDGTVGINPVQRLSILGGVHYYDNLLGSLQQTLLPAGGLPISAYNVGSNGVTLNVFGTYNLGHNLMLIGYANRQQQYFQGTEYTNNQYGGTLSYTYAKPLFGMLYLSFGTVNTAGNNNQGTLGFIGNVGLKKQIHSWDINGDFSYNQSVQSSVALFTTSNFSYGGFVRKRFGANTYWAASARSVQSGITQFSGYDNRSETFTTTLTRGRFGLSGSYSQSHGTSVLTTSGALVPTPLAPVLTPYEVLYDGTAYGGGISVSPLRRMVITANWLRASTQTTSITAFSNNDNNRVYAQMQYNLRKLTFRAVYWRVNQLIGISSLPRTTENSYSFTISRWFNIF